MRPNEAQRTPSVKSREAQYKADAKGKLLRPNRIARYRQSYLTLPYSHLSTAPSSLLFLLPLPLSFAFLLFSLFKQLS